MRWLPTLSLNFFFFCILRYICPCLNSFQFNRRTQNKTDRKAYPKSRTKYKNMINDSTAKQVAMCVNPVIVLPPQGPRGWEKKSCNCQHVCNSAQSICPKPTTRIMIHKKSFTLGYVHSSSKFFLDHGTFKYLRKALDPPFGINMYTDRETQMFACGSSARSPLDLLGSRCLWTLKWCLLGNDWTQSDDAHERNSNWTEILKAIDTGQLMPLGGVYNP